MTAGRPGTHGSRGPWRPRPGLRRWGNQRAWFPARSVGWQDLEVSWAANRGLSGGLAVRSPSKPESVVLCVEVMQGRLPKAHGPPLVSGGGGSCRPGLSPKQQIAHQPFLVYVYLQKCFKLCDTFLLKLLVVLGYLPPNNWAFQVRSTFKVKN